VSRLTLSIHDVTDNDEVESAEMNIVKVAGTLEWVFTATESITVGHETEVRVTAFDLAGNKIEASSSFD
ncbi:MAG: hypothetical protein J0M11_18545, partial [Anaerolineae bacterium]|nr:hypothetical protein [Anaerolineae bacterium]